MTSRNDLVASAALAAILAWAMSPAQAQDSGARGEQLFQRQCMTCHTLQPGTHRIGPSLADIFGEKAGTVPGYRQYSQALIQSDLVWDHDSLDRWIRAPNEVIPGNRMAYPGLKDAQDREALIVYLEEQQVEQPDGQQQEQQGSQQRSRQPSPREQPAQTAGGQAPDGAQASGKPEPVVGIGSVERRSSAVPGGSREIVNPELSRDE